MTGTLLLVGPDGAGKSTVLAEIEQVVGRDQLARAHLRPHLFSRDVGDGAPVTDPHGQPPRGLVLSLVKLVVVWLDTVFGGFLRWRPLARDGLLVVERGWFDQAVDPLRYRLPVRLRALIALLGRLTPRADVVVILAGDPAAFHARKPEIGEHEVAQQLAAWRTYAPRAGRRVVEVDTVTQSSRQAGAEVLASLRGTATPAWRRVPAAPRRLDLRATGPSRALDVYRPFSRWARLAVRANSALLATRLAPAATAPPVPRLGDLLHDLQVDDHHLAAFRSSREGRWVLAAADDDTLTAVVKVGRPQDDALRNELAVLERLAAPSGVRIPRVRWSELAEDRIVLACDALPAPHAEPSLAEVARLCTRLVRGDFGLPVVHGDLAPWNVGWVDGELLVWDWEDARPGTSAPLHDLAHYVVRAGLLLGRWRPDQAAARLVGPGSPGCEHLRALGHEPVDAPHHLAVYLACTPAAEARERAYRDAVARHAGLSAHAPR